MVILKWPTIDGYIRKSVFKFVKKCVQGHTVPSILKKILDVIIQSVCTLLDKATFYIRLLRGPRSQKDPSIWLNFFMEFRIYLTFTIFFYLYIVFNHDQYQCNVYMYIVDLVHCCAQAPIDNRLIFASEGGTPSGISRQRFIFLSLFEGEINRSKWL